MLQLKPGLKEGMPFRTHFPAHISWLVVVESWCPYCVAACESLSEAIGSELNREWCQTNGGRGLLVCGMLDLLQGRWECERMAEDGGEAYSVERNREGARVMLERELNIPLGLPVPFYVPLWRGTHQLDLTLSVASRGMYCVTVSRPQLG